MLNKYIIENNLESIHTILGKVDRKSKLYIILKRVYKLFNVYNISYLVNLIENQLHNKVDGFIFELLSDIIVARILGVQKRIILLYYITS